MCTAGRIKHHLKANIWRSESTVLFVGYQAPGTLGHIITSGAKMVRIHGQECKVKASIRRLGNYSAHADQMELIDWVLERGPVTGGLFLNHGEDEARAVMRQMLAKKGLDADKIFVPSFDESFELQPGTAATSMGRPAEPARKRIDESQLCRDWHNEYAAFILELSTKLQATDEPCDRSALIKELASVLAKQ